jgi:hypothetical protein
MSLGVSRVRLGDEVTLIGGDGGERIDVTELADWAGTISGISSRASVGAWSISASDAAGSARRSDQRKKRMV